ncbi:hypothetical protein PUNSTDRAFT_59004 [Punctularia strigosozonata HHB-11173 SS5]|uniref:uncharacterized protein n=1 Tax=Punctularia strigosozonata (strain HHB-11173) TaxID=741275 RepID=UPI0004417432|nr:uncharacterized protein PUNSTDRAFT_59004 [Punctularia strigosozonata HHB-11173 SS5]EIN13305.1 hypothetical protein PUNSTDRAFT_59004 [Punctularia strigosozonata HHB-11173 SS5]
MESDFSVVHETHGVVTQKLRFRDPLECIKSLYANPDFTDHMSYAPVRDFCDTENTQRMYSEMNTGDWWWETQAKLPDGATVVPVILSSDKTQLSTFSGDQQVHPVYLSIGNISKDIRRKPSYHAQVLIAYLPITDMSHLPDDVARVMRARSFHAAMRVVLRSLEDAGKTGVELTGGDGAVRLAFPIVAVYVADHPEQSLVCCTRFGQRCPKCSAAATDFAKHRLSSWTLRKQTDTLHNLRRAQAHGSYRKAEAALKAAGLTHVDDPFWAHLPHCNIHSAISADVLHQLYQGMLMHLIEWLTALIGASELDARLRRLPETHGVRHFANGISGLAQVSGPERKQMVKQLLGCAVGAISPRALRATRCLFDFIFIAQYISHSDETLQYLDEALAGFHADKQVFIDECARAVPNFNIPKLHMLSHYVDGIRAVGTTDNTNTETSERLHIDNAKRAYDATNKKQDYVEQMTRWLERYEKLALRDVHIRWYTNTLPPPPRTRSRRMKILPCGPTLSKFPHVTAVSFTSIASNYHAPRFLDALRAFIAISRCSTERERAAARRRNHDNLEVPFNWVDVWHRATFVISNIQIDGAPDFVTTPVANPFGGRDRSGRFDTVLVDVADADDTGIEGLGVARVRVFFKVPEQFSKAMFTDYGVSSPGHLAFVEWYTPPSSKNRHHQMYSVTRKRGQPKVGIIEVCKIRRNCQLFPMFGEKADKSWSSTNVLDRCEKFLVNNFQDQHAYQSLW